MMKRSIGKRCEADGCSLNGQLQESALVICPECGSDLNDVRVVDKRAQAILVAVLALVGAVAGFSIYGYVARALNPVQMLMVLLRQIEISDTLQSSGSADWVEARAHFFNDKGLLPGMKGEFLLQTEDGRRTATLRDRLEPNTLVSFDVRPATAGVSSVYFLHAGSQQTRVLFAAESAPAQGAGISIPGKGVDGRETGIELTGADTEHFVLIAARKPVPLLSAFVGRTEEAPVAPADISAVVSQLERDNDAYVLHVFVPHS